MTAESHARSGTTAKSLPSISISPLSDNSWQQRPAGSIFRTRGAEQDDEFAFRTPDVDPVRHGHD